MEREEAAERISDEVAYLWVPLGAGAYFFNA